MDKHISTGDRRREDREPTQNCASIEVHGGCDHAIGVVTDVSASGIGLRTGQPPRVGDRVTVRVTAPDETEIHAIGAIVRRVLELGRDSYMVGLSYDDPLSSDPFLEGVLGKTVVDG